jgi:hypothetical protein
MGINLKSLTGSGQAFFFTTIFLRCFTNNSPKRQASHNYG